MATLRTAPTLADVQEARQRLFGIAEETPIYLSETFSRRCGREVRLKAENLQRTGSFKVRGAVNKLSTLTPEERAPHQLRNDVEMIQEYDLAYWWYDYPDETFWLMPLLGPGGKNGENFLRYHGPLVRQVQGMTGLRHFADVRKQAHAIHLQHLEGEMPFVPSFTATGWKPTPPRPSSTPRRPA